MKLSEAFGKTRIIRYKPDSPEVMETVASLFLNKFADVMELKGTLDGNEQEEFFILVCRKKKLLWVSFSDCRKTVQELFM